MQSEISPHAMPPSSEPPSFSKIRGSQKWRTTFNEPPSRGIQLRIGINKGMVIANTRTVAIIPAINTAPCDKSSWGFSSNQFNGSKDVRDYPMQCCTEANYHQGK